MKDNTEKNMQSTKQQKQLIHILAKTLGHDRDTYEFILFTRYGKKSSTELSKSEAAELISEWQLKAEKTGALKNVQKKINPLKEKYENLGIRPTFATPKQLRMLEAIWVDCSRTKTEKSLYQFIFHIIKVSHPRFLKKSEVQKVKKAIESLKRNEK